MLNRNLIYFVCFFLAHLACQACEKKDDPEIGAQPETAAQNVTFLEFLKVPSEDNLKRTPDDLVSNSKSSSGGLASKSKSSSGDSEKEEYLEKTKKRRLVRTLSVNRSSKVKSQPEKLDEHSTGLSEVNNMEWLHWDVGKIVQFLTERDHLLFQAIKPEDIQNYLENQNNLSVPLIALTNFFNRTSHWFVFQIVRAKTETERENIIKRLLFIGVLLLKKHNFHGTMQITLALSNSNVMHLLPKQKTKEKSQRLSFGNMDSHCENSSYLTHPYWKEISGSMDPCDNFKNYRNLLAQHQDEPTCLPNFSNLLKDLLLAGKSSAHIEMERITGILKKLSDNPIPDNRNDPIFQFVSQLPEVSDETIEELTHLRKEWDHLMKRSTSFPSKLTDWTASHLASLFTKYDCQKQIEIIFDLGIYKGMDLPFGIIINDQYGI